MKEIEVNGLKVAYRDNGEAGARGETVLLTHCSNGSSKEWASLTPLLIKKGYRVLVPDLTGYGNSDPWPENRPFDADADVNIARALADLVEGPLHLVGHSYGGAITLETARHLGSRIRSISVVEPILFQLLHETGHRQWSVVYRLGNRVLEAMEQGDSRRAAYIFTSFWIGRLKWYLLPERHKRAIAETMKKVVLEFEIIDLAHRTPEHYAGINAPVQLILGTRTRSPATAVTELLHGVMPRSHVSFVKAGHMSPYTHPDKINPLILGHLPEA